MSASLEGGVALSASDIVVDYKTKRGSVRAVDSVSLEIRTGETLGLVGESGCGKSSLGRSLVQLPPPTGGAVRIGTSVLTGLSESKLRPYRSRIQMIFQDPISSLNPRRSAEQIVAEPLRLHKHADPLGRARETLREVGVDERMARRRPHELSGGQCQRISIARALVQEPDILVCDEPVSALDVSVQAQVLNLLEEMKERYSLSMLFISHDLSVISSICDRVAVMYLGRVCELASTTDLFSRPEHPYTELLLSSVPQSRFTPRDGDNAARDGDNTIGEPQMSALALESCRFASRCPAATDRCRQEQPGLVEMAAGHRVACHHPSSQLAVDL